MVLGKNSFTEEPTFYELVLKHEQKFAMIDVGTLRESGE